MLHKYIVDNKGNVVYSTIDPQCKSCLSQCHHESEVVANCGIPGKRRRGVKKLEVGVAFLCSDKNDHLVSAKQFKKELSFLAEMTLEIADIRETLTREERKRTDRLLHNLVKLNALELQEIYSLIPQDGLANVKYKDQLSIIENIVKKDASEASSVLLRLLKNAVSTKNEISAYKKLNGVMSEIRPAMHSIHKVVLNVASLFYQTILERNLGITLGESKEQLFFDYESIQVALYHLLDNSCKYAESGTDIVVSFEDLGNRYQVVFQMESLYIPDDEAEKIFEPGISGSQPVLMGNAGDGTGMEIIRDALSRNRASFNIIRGKARAPKATLYPRGLLYATNKFVIDFDKNKA